MIHSSFCYAFKDGDFGDNLKRLADCGFEGAELWPGDLVTRPISETTRALDAAGLKCSQICPYFNFVGSADEWQESIDLGLTYIEYARELGSPLIRVFTGPMSESLGVYGRDATIEQWDGAIRGLAHLCVEAENYGIRLCLECHPGQLAEDSHCALKLVESVRSPSLTLNPQIPLYREDPWYSLGRLAGHIAHFHAHNWSDHIDGKLTTLRDGIFDWESFLTMAIGDGFDGYVSIEHASESGGGDPWKAAEIDGPYLRELAGKLNV